MLITFVKGYEWIVNKPLFLIINMIKTEYEIILIVFVQ